MPPRDAAYIALAVLRATFSGNSQCSKWDGIRRYGIPALLVGWRSHTGTYFRIKPYLNALLRLAIPPYRHFFLPHTGTFFSPLRPLVATIRVEPSVFVFLAII